MPVAEKDRILIRNTAIVSLVLLAQAGLFYGAARYENPPNIPPLDGFPREIAGWSTIAEIPMEPAVQEVLKADDTLNRHYARPDAPVPVNLFIAFFRSQRAGQAPHSPKNCLPGAGFEPLESGGFDIPLPARSPIRVNRYLVVRGEDRSLVLYWYQSNGRVIGNEFAAKFWLVADSIRYHRSDTALVRVVIPVTGATENAERTGMGFIQDCFPALLQALSPSN